MAVVDLYHVRWRKGVKTHTSNGHRSDGGWTSGCGGSIMSIAGPYDRCNWRRVVAPKGDEMGSAEIRDRPGCERSGFVKNWFPTCRNRGSVGQRTLVASYTSFARATRQRAGAGKRTHAGAFVPDARARLGEVHDPPNAKALNLPGSGERSRP
jgi:hypothetical protein